jgi:hypothetical protein
MAICEQLLTKPSCKSITQARRFEFKIKISKEYNLKNNEQLTFEFQICGTPDKFDQSSIRLIVDEYRNRSIFELSDLCTNLTEILPLYELIQAYESLK